MGSTVMCSSINLTAVLIDTWPFNKNVLIPTKGQLMQIFMRLSFACTHRTRARSLVCLAAFTPNKLILRNQTAGITKSVISRQGIIKTVAS